MLKLLCLCLAITSCLAIITFDVNMTTKYGGFDKIQNTSCIKDTQIDLFFSSNSKVTCNPICTSTNLNQSYLKFLDINGNDLELQLVSSQVVNSSYFMAINLEFTPNYYLFFRFQTEGGGNAVNLVIPVVTSDTNNTSVVILNNLNDEAFTIFKNIVKPQSYTLDGFNFLNLRDYGKFYHVTTTNLTQTLLMSTFTYKITGSALSTSPLTYSFEGDYANSGNKLCYASNQVQGLFQGHLRQSWPLWTWIISIMFYWLYYLLADSESHACYDKHFEENKMTCWSFYSLHYLGHVEYFSRLSRVSLLFFVFSFQALVLAALYSTLGQKKAPYTNYEMIIWTAVIAFGVSLPLPYVLGGIFLRGIYNTTLKKFQTIKKSRGIMINKTQQQQIYSHEIDRLQQKLYSYYYIYYMVIFIGMVCFWVPAIYMMMYIPRQWFYLHRIWLASLVIAFAIENLIFDPILSFLLGNTRFYRIRGFFYNFALGQQFKQIEE